MTERLTETCTCDDFSDDPCPRHWRENRLEDELIRWRNQALEARAKYCRRVWETTAGITLAEIARSEGWDPADLGFE